MLTRRAGAQARAPAESPSEGVDHGGGAAETGDSFAPYIAFALRWWWLLLIGSLVGASGALAYLRYGPVPYESTALILVPAQANPADPTAGSSQVRDAASNFAAQILTPPIFEQVIAFLRDRREPGWRPIKARDLQEMVQDRTIDARQRSGTNFISITVTDSDPTFAQRLAQTIAAVFVNDFNSRSMEQAEARRQQLQQQIEITRQLLITARLHQREQELVKDVYARRSQLLMLQASYRQEIYQQMEMARLRALVGSGSSDPLDRVHGEWLKILGDQQKQVVAGIAEVTAELDNVREALSKLPAGTDPALAAAFAAAYAEQLQNLTNDYVRLQLSSQATTAPLRLYGRASEPLSTQGLLKPLAAGVSAGVATSAGIAYLLELALGLVRRRRARVQRRRARAQRREAAPLTEPERAEQWTTVS